MSGEKVTSRIFPEKMGSILPSPKDFFSMGFNLGVLLSSQKGRKSLRGCTVFTFVLFFPLPKKGETFISGGLKNGGLQQRRRRVRTFGAFTTLLAFSKALGALQQKKPSHWGQTIGRFKKTVGNFQTWVLEQSFRTLLEAP